MFRLIEILLGLPRGFLSREGEVAIRFNPVWPLQDTIGPAVWNTLIAAGIIWLIVYVYRKEGRGPRVRVVLAILRGALAGLLLVLLNRPVVTLTQNRVEPSVVAVLVDDSLSMRVRDVASAGENGTTRPAVTRLSAVIDMLGGPSAGLLKDLSRDHVIRLYRFDRQAGLLGTVEKTPDGQLAVPDALEKVTADGAATAVGDSISQVVSDLAGQRLAGVVVLTDGRESPAKQTNDVLARLRDAGAKVFAVEVGGDRPPRNLSIQNLVVQDSAFKGDLVNAKVSVRGTGFEPGSRATVRLVDARTGRPITGVGGAAEQAVTLDGDKPVDIEVTFKPEDIGELELKAVVTSSDGTAGEVDDADNSRLASIAVLDAKVNLLYVEGYPRWDYRFLRTELMRDKTVDVSILLTSADAGFSQDGDKPIRRFPETMEEILQYDAILLGDVDPRQFTDAQLQLLADYVGKKGGGFAMVAGPRWSPAAYRNSPLEAVLPVMIDHVAAESVAGDMTIGFRPIITSAGLDSGIFRFFLNRPENDQYLKEKLQMLFWYLHGTSVKPGAGEVLAEHPTDLGPDGKKAPLLVVGRYGAGRTIFSAIDDSWRWRYYTGESVFDTYWVQQIRLLARGRKLGQRLFTLETSRSAYELGEAVTVNLHVLESNLLKQMPDRIDAEVTDADGHTLRRETLVRQEDRPDTYVGAWRADRVGRGNIKVAAIAPGANDASVPLEVIAPRLELADPRIDRPALQRLASETFGQSIPLDQARSRLPGLITSAAKVIPLESSRPLWDAPLAMAVFVLLITAEWVLRKLFGMV